MRTGCISRKGGRYVPTEVEKCIIKSRSSKYDSEVPSNLLRRREDENDATTRQWDYMDHEKRWEYRVVLAILVFF